MHEPRGGRGGKCRAAVAGGGAERERGNVLFLTYSLLRNLPDGAREQWWSGLTPPRVRIGGSRIGPPRARAAGEKNADLKALMPIFLEFGVLIWAR